jgi:hypothetical protein
MSEKSVRLKDLLRESAEIQQDLLAMAMNRHRLEKRAAELTELVKLASETHDDTAKNP